MLFNFLEENKKQTNKKARRKEGKEEGEKGRRKGRKLGGKEEGRKNKYMYSHDIISYLVIIYIKKAHFLLCYPMGNGCCSPTAKKNTPPRLPQWDQV